MDHIISQVDENHDDEVDLSLACSVSLAKISLQGSGGSPNADPSCRHDHSGLQRISAFG